MSEEEITNPGVFNLEQLPPGFLLRDLVLSERIGRGGFGVVYKATRGTRTYAVKVPRIDVSGSDAEARARAEKELADMSRRISTEISSLKAVRHKSVIEVTEFFSWDPTSGDIGGESGVPIIVMPFIAGPQMDTWVERDKPSLRQILYAFRDLADALEEVHRRSISHRDIKPENILMTPAGYPVLIDFGIAKGQAAATNTERGSLLGTKHYFPPEYVTYYRTRGALKGQPYRFLPTHDLFALGSTFYRLLTGLHATAPFVGESAFEGSGVDQRLIELADECNWIAPSRLNPAVPPELDAIILKLIELRPADRFQAGREVIRMVEQLIASLPKPAAVLDEPFLLPPEDELRRRSRESSEEQLKKHLEGELLAGAELGPNGSVEVSLSSMKASAAQPDETAPRKPPLVVLTRNVRGAPSVLAPAPAAAGSKTSSFRAPTGVTPPPPFEAPLPAMQKAAQSEMAVDPELERLRRDLAANALGARRPTALIVGLGLAAVVALVALVLALRHSAPATQPVSLLDEAEKKASATPAPLPPPLAAPMPAPLPVATQAESLDAGLLVAAVKPSARSNPDAKAIDDILKREYGGQRPTLSADGKLVGAPSQSAPHTAPASEPDFVVRAAGPGAKQAAAGPRKFGIPLGSEIPVKLVKPLDSNSRPCIVVVKLARAYAPRGEVVLPTGTMVYGVASAGGGRFEVTFNRLKLPSGDEAALQAIAYDAADRKPGLSPSRRVTNAVQQGPGVAEQVAKTTANAALGKVAGGDGVDVARAAGQVVLNGQGSSGATAQEALLLDAPADLTIFVTEAF